MEKIVQMAESHLQNVKRAINDLLSQKQTIEQEIDKLNQYLEEGIKEIEANKTVDSN